MHFGLLDKTFKFNNLDDVIKYLSDKVEKNPKQKSEIKAPLLASGFCRGELGTFLDVLKFSNQDESFKIDYKEKKAGILKTLYLISMEGPMAKVLDVLQSIKNKLE